MNAWLHDFRLLSCNKQIYLNKGLILLVSHCFDQSLFVCSYLKFHFRSYLRLDSNNNFLSVPPLNLTVETMPYGYEYYGYIDETINCTATVNPNTTVLFLIGKNIQSENKYFFAERKNVQTFVESENNTGCYPTVRTVFRELRYFLQIYNFVGCLASDTVSGQSSISEFKTVFVLIINWVMWPISLSFVWCQIVLSEKYI